MGGRDMSSIILGYLVAFFEAAGQGKCVFCVFPDYYDIFSGTCFLKDYCL
jgi:hypothetical protein